MQTGVKMEIEAIAHIYTGFKEKFGIPRQSGLVERSRAEIVFEPKYRHPDAIRGIEQYSHLWLIWDFSENHREGWNATVTPPRLGGKERVGVFATRSPFRPNNLGLSCVSFEGIREDEKLGMVIVVGGADMLDKTPIYDIKPYLPYADAHPEALGGFGEAGKKHRLKADFATGVGDELDEDERECIRELVALDPRTAFIHDEERIWGIRYGVLNVRFKTAGDTAVITEIQHCV